MTRSNLHRCLVRNGLNRLPKEENEKKKTKPFKEYSIGFVHIDISEIHTEQGKVYMFVAIERLTKYTYVEIYEKMTQKNSCLFLSNFIKDVPFKIHKILTDNGIQFTYALLAKHLQPKEKIHPFVQICIDNDIENRLTKFRHPWTNGQVEIMNKIIKSYTVKKYHYETLDQITKHVMAFLLVYNYQKKLVALKYQTPYNKMVQIFKETPVFFKSDPRDKTMGRYK
jgi:IS30 family transposase